ncbi:phage tail spike protein, partial [Streptococcus agalactiae]
MLYLLDGQTKTAKWNGQPLFETVSATVEEELNGIFQLRLTYPITDSGVHETLRADELILCPTPDLGNQLFRVKQAKIQDDRVELECSHISDDVMKRQIKPFSATNTTCQSALMRMVEVCPSDLGLFSFDSDVTERHTYVSDEDLTLYQALMDGKHSILGTWEGELVRDNFQLIVKKHRGNDKGVILTSHHNLKAFEDKGDSEKVITRIYATSTFQIEGSDEDTVLSVVVESPLINQYPYVHEARYENNTLQTEEELRQWAMAKFTHEHIDSISRQITVEAYQLDGQEVHLGDTVTLKSQKHKVDVKKKAVSYTFDALEEVYLLVTFDDEVSFTTSGSSGNNSLTSAAKTILDVNQSATEHRASKERANFKKVFDRHFERLQTEVEDGIAKAKAEGERSGKKAALDYLATDALEARVAALQKATIDELTVSSSAWMTRLVSQQILSEYVKSLEIEADKVVIPGQHTPVFSLDRDGSLSIDTPLLKVRGDSLATKVDLKTISLTPGPKGDAGADGVGIQLREQYYLVSAQKTGITTTSSGWSKTIPSLTSTLKYLWNYEKTTFTNGST